MTLQFDDFLIILAFAFPSMFLFFRYRKKTGEHKLKNHEAAGILTCTAAMVVFLFYILYAQIFY